MNLGLVARRALVTLAIGCVLLSSGCVSYTVRQSALVPPPALPPSGHRVGVLDVHVTDSTVTFLSVPERAPNSDAGLWITRHLLQAGVSARMGRYLAIRAHGLVGLSDDAMAAAPTTLRNPGQHVSGFGGGVELRHGVGPHHFNLTLDTRFLSVPTYYEVICHDPQDLEGLCPDPNQGGQRRQEGVLQALLTATYSAELHPGIRSVFAVSLQNHPTNRERFESSTPSPQVHEGPLNAVVAIGLDVDVTDWFGIVPTLQWPVTRDPVVYGPILGVGLRGSILGPQPPPPPRSQQVAGGAVE